MRARFRSVGLVLCVAGTICQVQAAIRYVTPYGNDTNSCSSPTSSCLTINGAYQKASPGDTIQVAGGTYGNQTINFRSSMSAAVVIVQPAPDATPVFADVNIRASYLNFIGPMIMRTLDLGDSNYRNRTQNVTIDNITVDHQRSATPDWRAMKVWATDNVTLRNSRVGNTLAGYNVGQDSNLIQFGGGTYSTNFTIDSVRFHNNDAPSGAASHNECIYAINVQGFTVKNSRFESCTYYGILFTDFLNGQPSLKNVTIENNVFSQGRNTSGGPFPYAIDIHANVAPNNFKFRYNTFENWVGFSFGRALTNGFEVKGNIFGLGVVADWTVGTFACKPGVTFSYNVMPQPCGTNSKVASSAAIRSGWAGPSTTWGAADDFNLISSSPAVGAGDPGSFPTTDISGRTRVSESVDAGAYEFGASGPPNPPTGLQATVK